MWIAEIADVEMGPVGVAEAWLAFVLAAKDVELDADPEEMAVETSPSEDADETGGTDDPPPQDHQ